MSARNEAPPYRRFQRACDCRMVETWAKADNAAGIFKKWKRTNRIAGQVLRAVESNYETAYRMIGARLNVPWVTARSLVQGDFGAAMHKAREAVRDHAPQ